MSWDQILSTYPNAFSSDKTELLSFNDNAGISFFKNLSGKLIISNTIKSIEMGAFFECGSIKSVIIPASVTKIEDGAFAYCSALSEVEFKGSLKTLPASVFCCCPIETIIFPSSLKNIGDNALNYSSIHHLTIPDGVTSIGSSAFEGSSLETINIPKTVDSIGSAAFSACLNLRTINYGGTIAEWNDVIKENAFINGNSNISVVCVNGNIALDGSN